MEPLKQSLKVLVVDDNRDNAITLGMLIKFRGFQVAECFDGSSAIRLAETWNPDLVLLDLAMPVVNGFEVCRALRQTEHGQHIIIAAQTSRSGESDRELTRQAGFDYHLTKPINMQLLDEVLESSKEHT